MILPTLTYTALPIEEDRVCGLILRDAMRRFHDTGKAQRCDFSGSMCYVLHNAENDSVKIGRTGELRKRWRDLENASGVELTPLVVWYTRDSALLEINLHDAFSYARRPRGEWFDAAGVLPSLSTVIAGAEIYIAPRAQPVWMDDEDTAPFPRSDPQAALEAMISNSQSKLDSLFDLVSEGGES